ncbi:MAG: hypothetical protein QXQ02_03705 [Halobacteria archaeon]
MIRPAYYKNASAITPSDTAENAFDAIYVGAAGNLAVVTEGNQSVTLTGVLAGHIYPIRTKKVMATGTTAGSLVGLYT